MKTSASEISFAELHLNQKTGTVSSTPYFQLPSGLYVNSSCLSQKRQVYYALLSPIPSSSPNSSVAGPQQLLSVAVDGPKPSAPTVVALPAPSQSGLQLLSIAFSDPTGQLYALAWDEGNQTAVMATVDPSSGALSPLWYNNLATGPIVADSVQHNVYEFANNLGPAGFSVVDYDLYNSPGFSGSIKTNYPGDFQAVAASFFEEITF